MRGTLPQICRIDKKNHDTRAMKYSSNLSYCYNYHNAHSVCWKWYRLPLHRQRSYRKFRILYSCSRPRLRISYRYVIRTSFESESHISHSQGVFKKILPLTSSHSLRVICLSRREYEGSTPYSADELKTIHHGSDAECADFFYNEGIFLALFIAGLIQSLSLPTKGGVTVAGWSLGNTFVIAMRASINDLPDDTKQRLKAYIRGFIIFGLSLCCSS